MGAEIRQAAPFIIGAALQALKQRLAHRDIDTPGAPYCKTFRHDSAGEGVLPMPSF
jgi:hypothetical protein